MAKVTIIAIGNELVSGRLVDTNTAYIAVALRKLGVSNVSARLVADDLVEISGAIKEASNTSDFLILTGGLGPTADDGTRQAIAAAASEELELSEGAKNKLKAFVESRGRVLNENNLRQAYFPRSARILVNDMGTADAFLVKIPRKESSATVPLVSLPGVPREMKKLLDEQVLGILQESLPSLPSFSTTTLRCFGLPESEIGELLEKAMLSPEVEVSYRPQFPEIMLQLSTSANENAERLLEETKSKVVEALGSDRIFSNAESEKLPLTVLKLLTERHKTVAFAESCTGGLLADSFVAHEGASKVLIASVVSYANQAKQDLLSVPAEMLAQHGAVSAEVVKEMAKNVRSIAKSDYALSVSGIAGPGGGTDEKPVGTVWIGLAAEDSLQAFYFKLPWPRDFVRRFSCHQALDILRRKVLGLALPDFE